MPDTPKFGCPKCGSPNVSELNVVDVLLPVTEWDADGEPEAFGQREILDGTISTKQSVGIFFENEPRYQCGDCNQTFDIPKKLSRRRSNGKCSRKRNH